MTAAPSTPAASNDGRVIVTREFRDVLDRPQRGWVKIMSPTWGRATAQVVDGVLTLSLLPGRYEISAALWGPDNQVTRQTLVVVVPGPSDADETKLGS